MEQASLLNLLLRARLEAGRRRPPGASEHRAAGGALPARVSRVRDLLARSRARRGRDGRGSLHLARMAAAAACAEAGAGRLPGGALSDLRVEALINLGQAHLEFSDLAAAGRAADRARRLRAAGSRSLALEADLLALRASILGLREEAAAAAGLRDREIELRRRQGDPEPLAAALVNRGLLSAWFEPLEAMCGYLEEAVRTSRDPRVALLALETLARALERQGSSLASWYAGR